MRLFLSGILGIAIVRFATGCSGENEAAGKVCTSIVGGERDLTHSGVVALLSAEDRLVCSATLVGRAAGQAVFLSAAHCLLDAPTQIAVGPDYRSPTRSLPIVREVEHPKFDYTTGAYDFVLLVADQALDDVIAIEVPRGDDGLSVGSELRFVGFGEDENATQSSVRQEVVGAVDKLTSTSLEYEQKRGGPCGGDSGGPAIATREGQDFIVGITSFGGDGCWSRGTSARVVAASEFINAEIDQPPSHCL